MAYQSGELTERVTFRRAVLTPDGQGGSTKTMQQIATVWALVRPMSGRERLASERIEASSNYLIVVRARSDLREADVAEWQGRDGNIRFLKNRPRSAWLEMETQFGVAT